MSVALSSRKPPHSWMWLGVGLAMVALLGVTTGVLIVDSMARRPVNFGPKTMELTSFVRQALQNNQIPPANIHQGAPEQRSDKEAIWRFTTIEVDVPQFLSVEGVARLIRKNMTMHQVAVSQASNADPRLHTLLLALGAREFAEIRLAGGPERLDLTEGCALVADATAAALTACGVPRDRLGRGPIALHETNVARWACTPFAIALPQSFTPDTLRARLEEAMASQDATIALNAGGTSPQAHLLIALSGYECVDIALSEIALPPPPPAAQPTPAAPQAPPAAPPSPETEAPPESAPAAEKSPAPAPAAPPAPEAAQAPPAAPGAPGQLRVSIIVDDGGYGGATTEAILALTSKLTVAILPNATQTTQTAQRATALGFEVILHMPMENISDKEDYPHHLECSMKEEEIRKLTEEALAQVPGAVGVNNHEGSKYTADAAAMRLFLKVLLDRGLYFVDSKTVADSVGYEEAKALGLRTLSRDVFLDHNGDGQFIRRQFDELIEEAKEKGSALGICHFRAKTAELLPELLPKLEQNGIVLVHVSELLQ